MHRWPRSAPEGELSNSIIPLIKTCQWFPTTCKIKSKLPNLGFKGLMCWVIIQSIFVECQLDTMHCAKCWRQASLTRHSSLPRWTSYSQRGMQNRKQSHITWGVCLCREPCRIKVCSVIKKEQHLAQAEVGRGGGEEGRGQSGKQGWESGKAFLEKVSRTSNMKWQLDESGRGDKWRWTVFQTEDRVCMALCLNSISTPADLQFLFNTFTYLCL